MNGDFDVFDEWGGYLGRFIPAGGGCANSIILVIALLIMWTIGFAFYLIFKLTTGIIKELLKTRAGKITLVVVPTIAALLSVGLILLTVISSGVREAQAREKAEAQTRSIEGWIESFALVEFSGRARRIGCAGSSWDCPGVKLELELTGNWSDPIVVNSVEPEKVLCNLDQQSVVNPGQAFVLMCTDSSTRYLGSGVVVPQDPKRPGLVINQVCITVSPARQGAIAELVPEASIPVRKICMQVPMRTFWK